MEELEITEKIAVKDPIIIWKSCLLKIKESVSMMTYNTWFLPIKPVELIDSTLKVQIPSQFFWEWIDEHFNILITKSITEILGKEARLTYVIAEDLSFSNERESVREKPLNPLGAAEKSKPKHTFESNLNPRYTFDNFIKGEGNQLARAA
ncbi:MAG TPA: DnaA N-terminal domain-containing protein, partial [Ignavibacteriaceae bacterium]